jgi:hypothetical protein
MIPMMERFLVPRHFLILFFLYAAALTIRLYHVNEPPLNFHATRQYRSLIIARGFYYEHSADIPEWKRQIASLNKNGQGILEPPVMELLTALGYRILGGEQYWISKSLSIIFWLTGAFFLYKIAKVISSETAALFAIAFYLFLPFAVIASRSFQPDPLMVMLLLAGIHAMVRYNEQPSTTHLMAASALSAFAIFIKPISLFVIYTVFIFLSVQRQGIRKSIATPGLWLYFLASLLPALGFYLIYGIFMSGDLQVQAQSSFLPQLLLDRFFWRGWLDNIHTVIGFPALIAALLGALLYPKGFPRALIVGLWVGYGLFCLVFNYHIATHDYYHLQLIPIAALSLGPVFALTLDRLLEVNRGKILRLAIGAALMAGLILSLHSAHSDLSRRNSEGEVKRAEQVGELVHHNTNTIFLASDYGLSLQYHGELSGQPWPLVSDLEWEQLAGASALNAEARFMDWFAEREPDYFIVMDLWELEQQKDLNEFLTQNFSRITQTDDVIVFDLRQKLK